MKPLWSCVRHTALRLVLAFAALLPITSCAQQASIVVDVPVLEIGSYDAYGEYFPNNWTVEELSLAGRRGLGDPRGPCRIFLTFSIPNIPGTITNAEFLIWSYNQGSDEETETLRLREIATPAHLLRHGGFNLTNVYADLADGPVYGSIAFHSSWSGINPLRSFTPDFLPALSAARGTDFSIGGELTTLSTNANLPFYVWEFLSFTPGSIFLRLSVSAPALPSIYAEPLVTLVASNIAVARIGASGATPLDFHWFVDGAPVEYRNGPEVGLGYFDAHTSHNTFVIVSNSFGAITSAVTHFTVPAANIYMPFTNALARAGDTVHLAPSVSFGGFPQLSYQWRKDGFALPGANSSMLTLANLLTNDAGDYTLAVSDGLATAISQGVRVDVIEMPPVFWNHPDSGTVSLGDTINLYADPQGSAPIAMQWYHNGTPVEDGLNTPRFHTRQPAALSDTGDYWLVASNSMGMATSQVAHIAVVLDPPVFTAQPEDRTVYVGQSVRFDVDVGNVRPSPRFRWYHNNVLLTNQTFDYLQINNVRPSSAGLYFCVASNASGIVTSEVAELTVIAVPPILGNLSNATAGAGLNLFWYSTLSNPPAWLQLQFYGTNVPGFRYEMPFTTFALNLYNLQTNQSGPYRIIASNEFGVTTGEVATLTVSYFPPAFAVDPVSQNVLEGSPVNFFAQASGAPPPAYFFRRHGEVIQMQTNHGFFSLPAVALADSGEFTVLASNLVGVATSRVARLTVVRAGPLDKWTPRNPLPQAQDLFAIAHGQGKFVAVGRNGAVLSSANGTNWNSHRYSTTAELQGVGYGGGKFVAVGERLILTSTNGENWSLSPLDIPSDLLGVAYGNGRFVAVGSSLSNSTGRVLVSSNGLLWTDTTFDGATIQFQGIAFGTGVFVTIDAGGRAWRSTDGVNWTNTLNNVPTDSVRFLNGQFVAVGNQGRMSTSPDGITWTAQNAGTRRLRDMAYGAGYYVGVGSDGYMIHSETGTLWTTNTPIVRDRIEEITFGNGLFVAVGERGMLLTSHDALTWSNQLHITADDLDGLTIGAGVAVAVGKNGTILTSPNGRDWTKRSTPVITGNADWHGVGYGDGKFVVVGEGTNILVSPDAVEWTAHSYVGTTADLKSVIYAGGQWIAVGVGGVILTSADATTWAQQASGTGFDLNDIAYGEGVYIVVGDAFPNPNGTILVSGDGVNWSDNSLGTGKNLRGITYQNGVFLITGNDDMILYRNSSSPIWQSAHYTGREGWNLRGATWSSNIWIAVGNNGRILTSTNGQNWPFSQGFRQRISPTTENLHAVRYINGTFIAVGNQGTILQSGPLEPRLDITRDGNNLRLLFNSGYDGIYTLQESADFQWQNAGFITNVPGTVERIIEPGTPYKFFRVIP